MLMIALQDVSSTVAVIPAGRQFHELDEERAALLMRQGFAKPVPDAASIKVNRRGWDGLLWDDAEVCIMASGPSMTQEQATAARIWESSGNRATIAINTTFKLAPWADVLYACDARWWRAHIEEVKDEFSGQLWSQDADCKNISGEIHIVQSERREGLSKTPGMIRQGMSSGYQAMNLAYLAGARRLILLGFDAKADGKQSHWHGDHPPGLNSTQPYKRWIENMHQMAIDLTAAGVSVVNASPGSAIRDFVMRDWREVLA